MSLFKNTVRTFKTNVTGETLSLKLNLAVWLYLEADFGIKQGDFEKEAREQNALTTAKFIVSLLKANGYDTTIEEVVDNLNESELYKFADEYQKFNLSVMQDTIADVEGKQQKKEKLKK